MELVTFLGLSQDGQAAYLNDLCDDVRMLERINNKLHDEHIDLQKKHLSLQDEFIAVYSELIAVKRDLFYATKAPEEK